MHGSWAITEYNRGKYFKIAYYFFGLQSRKIGSLKRTVGHSQHAAVRWIASGKENPGRLHETSEVIPYGVISWSLVDQLDQVKYPTLLFFPFMGGGGERGVASVASTAVVI